jgi:hypothetical protein
MDSTEHVYGRGTLHARWSTAGMMAYLEWKCLVAFSGRAPRFPRYSFARVYYAQLCLASLVACLKFIYPAVSIAGANCHCISKAISRLVLRFRSHSNASLHFPVSFQGKFAFPILVHGNLITGLIEMRHGGSKDRNSSIKLFQCFTRTAACHAHRDAGHQLC